MHEYAMYTYDAVRKFPKEEMFSSRSQLTRATLSVVLNYIEGYSRRRKRVQLNFYETAYGSLGESRYLYYFALCREWIMREDYEQVIKLADEIGRMLWSEITSTELAANTSG